MDSIPVLQRLSVSFFIVAVAFGVSAVLGPRPAVGQSSVMEVPESYLDAFQYRNIGPSRGGRVTAVAGHASHPGTFYMGATGGGVWKTENYGASWSPISDGFFATGSIGSIRVAPSDPSIVYVGTGSDGIRSNVITGRGVYRSNDAGRSWTHVGLKSSGQIGAVVIHPTDPELVYVAALGNAFGRNEERGVFKTDDGGANWRQVLFTSDSVGAIDLELHPTNPNVVYASMWRGERKPWTIISGMEAAGGEDGIWKSTDAGETWRRLDTGLPGGLIGKIDLAVSPADPDRVYALVETKEPEEGLYRSDDAGETWRMATNYKPLMDRPFYYTNVDADPTDADVVYVNATRFWKSTDAGESFTRIFTPHGDNHDMWINPDDPMLFIQSNDGGANVTRDGGSTWSSILNQPTAELYQVDVDDRFPFWLYAGQQDNSTIMVPSLPPEEDSQAGALGHWKAIGGCETGPAVPKPGDPNTVYANCKGRFGVYSHITGQERQYYVGAVNLYGDNPANLPYRFQRVVPIEVSPHDPSTVYHGSQFVHRTTDSGVTWEQISPDLTAFRPERQVASGTPITRDITGEEHYSVLYAIEESPITAGVIWTGANDGPVHVTRDGGETWMDVTPPMPAEGRVQNIDASPHRPGKAYVAAYRYLLGDFEPYIFRTDDYGETWTRLTTGLNGIPADFPTRVVREDPDREGLLYAGTEFGMFVSFDDGASWKPFQQNLPVTPITDIRVHRKSLAISTMGRSFWVLDNLTPLHQVSAEVLAADVALLAPDQAYRMRYGGWGGMGSDDSAEPTYRSAGADIDYFLGSEASAVKIEILDDDGELVRTYEGSGSGMRVERDQEMRGPFGRSMGRAAVPTSMGLNRFRWDLHHEAGRARSGPMAVPGEYTVRLTVDGWTDSTPLRVSIDPRVAEAGITQADLEEQLALNLRIRDVIGEARGAVDDLETAKTRTEEGVDLGGEAQRRAEAALAELMRVEDALVTKTEGSYQTPMLVDQLNYLYGMTTSADQRPGRDAYLRLEFLESELERHIDVLERILSNPITEQPPLR